MDSQVFATLQPTNLAAKVAFSKTAELSRCQPSPSWSQYMYIEPVPIYDADFARQCEQSAIAIDVDSEASITEPETDTEERRRDVYKLWTGCFIFDLSKRDPDLDTIWIAGKGRSDHRAPDGGVQFKLDSPELRGWHAKFTLSEAGFPAIMPASRSARNVTVGGRQVEASSPYHLNQGAFDVGIGDLSFRFTYTDYARSQEFGTLRTRFWTRLRDRRLMDANIAALSLTPMPPKDALTVGRYVLSTEIGRGGAGKVYSATDSTGTVFAIKMVERNKRTASSVAKEVRALEELTREAEEVHCDNVIRLVDVIGDCRSSTDNLLFKDIYFVFSTAAYCTVEDVVHSDSDVPLKTRIRYLRDILLGLKFLHARDWVHRDIKDANIGIYQDRAVLLDMGCVERLEAPLMTIAATPGYGGTVGYHAPETEMTGSRYGCAVDIWAAGIVGYALVYFQYPLCFSRNPWREGNDALRTLFHSRFRSMYERLQLSHHGAMGVNNLLMQMLRSEELQCNRGLRITADEGLAHPVWNCLLDDETYPPLKKIK